MNQAFVSRNATIFKLGGSLLTLPNVAERLLQLVDNGHFEESMVVVGGGAVADIVRCWDETLQLAPEVVHNLAVRAMSLNAEMFTGLNVRFRLGDGLMSEEESVGKRRHIVTIIEPHVCLEKLEQNCLDSELLSRSWQVTSDSIAAWIAGQAGADRLVLVKSLDLPAWARQYAASEMHVAERRSTLLQQLAEADLVDANFAQHGGCLSHLSWSNLRKDGGRTIVDIW